MATTAETMVAKLETLLADNAGVERVTLPDGRSVTYTDLKADYDYWQRRVAREAGTRPRLAQVNLGNF